MKSILKIFLLGTFILASSTMVWSQDRLVMTDGEVIPCKVIEISPDYIKYYKVSMPDGPIYSVYRNQVNSIVYENGEIELIRPVAVATQSAERERGSYRATWGYDLFAPAFGEVRFWFEVRNPKDRVGHTLNVTGMWDISRGRYGDDYFDEYYYYTYGGGLIFGYMPKVYFIRHRIARPYFAPEAALGFALHDFAGGYFRSMARLGVTINATPRFTIDFDIGGGGHVIFDGLTNFGEGYFTIGLSLGTSFGTWKRKPREIMVEE